MKKALKFILIGLGVLSVIGLIGAALSDSKTSKTPQTTNSGSPSIPTSSGDSKSYVKVLEITGIETKKSTVFELHGNHARMKYKYKSDTPDIGMFSVFIASDGEDISQTGGLPEVMATAVHENSESAIQKSAGKYYLDINASGSWSITIEEEQ